MLEINDDKINRDNCLKAYVCAVLDVPPTEYDDVMRNLDDKQLQGLKKIMIDDMYSRLDMLLMDRKK